MASVVVPAGRAQCQMSSARRMTFPVFYYTAFVCTIWTC